MDLTQVVFNTDYALQVGTLVLIGIAAIWGVRKAISMAGRQSQ